jgi:hypothetical protein
MPNKLPRSKSRASSVQGKPLDSAHGKLARYSGTSPEKFVSLSPPACRIGGYSASRNKTTQPESLKNILTNFNPLKDKYISREYQKYGYDLACILGDLEHKALYIKLAKEVPRHLLEKAKNFVRDAGRVRSRGRLFMWKLNELQKAGEKSRPSKP